MTTSIEWTRGDDGSPGSTWNPTRGCSRVSPGCERCYAEVIAARFSDERLDEQSGEHVHGPFHGFAERRKSGSRWTGKVSLMADKLSDPLHWKKPRRVFVNSMSDLFHERLSNEDIAAVFGVMAACPQHTFQILTKRAERLPEWFDWAARRGEDGLRMFPYDPADWRIRQLLHVTARRMGADALSPNHGGPWPLPNVWIGVSVEDQQRADERIPHLLATPAAVRFLSVEPLLGPIDLNAAAWGEGHPLPPLGIQARMIDDRPDAWKPPFTPLRALDWVICGSESGPGARPMAIEWARRIVDDCVAAGTPVFTKQIATDVGFACGDRKGVNPQHWPPGNWPREFPAVRP